MKYIVTELQTFENGAMSSPSYAYDNRNSAESKYHAILAAAAISALPTHAAVLMTNEGVVLDHAAYHHETASQEA